MHVACGDTADPTPAIGGTRQRRWGPQARGDVPDGWVGETQERGGYLICSFVAVALRRSLSAEGLGSGRVRAGAQSCRWPASSLTLTSPVVKTHGADNPISTIFKRTGPEW